jgi:allantoin racemase
VTTLERSRVPVEGLVHRYGMGSRCKVRAADVPVLALEDPASDAISKLRREIADAVAEDRAEAIVLGCAGMADLAAALSEEFGLPVIDGVAAAVKQAEALVGLGLSTSKRGAYARPLAKAYTGALQAFAPPSAAA